MRISPHLEMIRGTWNSLVLQQGPSGSSRLVAVFLGTLWNSIMEIKPPSVFDMEHGIALEAMQLNRASSHGEGRYLMVFVVLQWESGVSSWVTMARFLKHLCFLSDIRTPV